MLIHLSELFNCEGRKKVYTVETALDSVDFDGETFQIEKAEPFAEEQSKQKTVNMVDADLL